MRAAAAVLLALILALPVFAASRVDEPVPAFRSVDVHAMASTPGRSSPGRAGGPHRGNGADDRGQGGAVPPVDVRRLAAAHDEAAAAQPSPRLIVVPRGSPQPTSHRASGTATGRASWYCVTGRSRCTAGYGPSCLCAAAGPALRRALGSWRGRYVTVYGNGRHVRVRLIDCNCGPHANLIDLYGSAFTKLRPLSAGTVDVKVTW